MDLGDLVVDQGQGLGKVSGEKQREREREREQDASLITAELSLLIALLAVCGLACVMSTMPGLRERTRYQERESQMKTGGGEGHEKQRGEKERVQEVSLVAPLLHTEATEHQSRR